MFTVEWTNLLVFTVTNPFFVGIVLRILDVLSNTVALPSTFVAHCQEEAMISVRNMRCARLSAYLVTVKGYRLLLLGLRTHQRR
jgi:hypothetical protein